MGAILIAVRLMVPRFATLLLALAVGMAPISGALCEVICASKAGHAGEHLGSTQTAHDHDAVSGSAAHAAHMAHAEGHHDAAVPTIAAPAHTSVRALLRTVCCQEDGTSSRAVATTARSLNDLVATPAALPRLAHPAPATVWRFPGRSARPPLGRPSAPIVLRV
jgi:hypothetical protein